MSNRSFFITGTDTGIGKTLVACALLEAARDSDFKTIAIKPVSAGCEHTHQGLVNADALELQQAASVELEYAQVNPVALEPAIAPHIAAQQAGIRLEAGALINHVRELQNRDCDLSVIEGAGGWLVPLNETETMADVCAGLGAVAVLVVGIRLGCLNHAQMTAAAIQQSGVRLGAWVANCIVPAMPALEENLATLRDRLDAPCIGTIPFLDPCSPASAKAFLDLTSLTGTAR